jgi:hypothetical protein
LIDQGQPSIKSTDFVNCHPVISNSENKALPNSDPKQVLQDILTLRADWVNTVIGSVAHFKGDSPRIYTLGTQKILPRLALNATGSSFTMAIAQVNPVLAKEQSNGSGPNATKCTNKHPSVHITQNGITADVSGPNPTDSPIPYRKIAVIGMAGRFAKSDNLSELWSLLKSGRNAVSKVPTQRFQTSDLQREPKQEFFGNFLEEPDAFDHQFFGISSREAKSMDPQQRILLEVAYDALAFGGYFTRPKGKAERNVGCYVGVGSVDYDANVASHDAGAFSATGTLRAFISGKVSHHFGWSGPSSKFLYENYCEGKTGIRVLTLAP